VLVALQPEPLEISVISSVGGDISMACAGTIGGMSGSFDELVAEAEAAPVAGWDFS
jgi:hypothetical protein